MLKSMTAFGRSRRTVSGKDITAEIKSVNSRYLDCTVKISRMYSFLEDKIKTHLSSRGISRGKIEVYISIDLIEQEGVTINLDSAYAKSYIDSLYRLRDEFGLKDDISVMRVASNRDIFTVTKPEDDIEKDWNDVKPVIDEAIDGFLSVRENEGARLGADIAQKIELIRKNTDEIAEISREDISGYGAKLESRIKQLLAENSIQIDEQRILTEVAIFADRAAIDEEIVRLNSHFTAFEEIASSPEPAGRKLDFLIQEINRETNTIGSKANNVKIARLVVDIKSEIEKIREQIQNIE